MTGYIEREGRQFGFVTRIKVYLHGRTGVGEQVAEAEGPQYGVAFFCKVWAWLHGYGWLPVH